MLSREMVEMATNNALKDRAKALAVITTADKVIAFKMFHDFGLSSTEEDLRKALVAIGCTYPSI